MVTASVFGEMQSALNIIWKIKPSESDVETDRRAHCQSRSGGGVGFLLVISLVASAGIAAIGDVITGYLPFGALILGAINVIVSFALISLLFAAIYKVLPDRQLKWRDVIVGACITSALFAVGKSLIGWYLGSSAVASTYSTTGALIIVLLWIYYSSEIFLLGAEFTRQYALHGDPTSVPVSDGRSNVSSEVAAGAKSKIFSRPRRYHRLACSGAHVRHNRCSHVRTPTQEILVMEVERGNASAVFSRTFLSSHLPTFIAKGLEDP